MPVAVISTDGRMRLAKVFDGYVIDLAVPQPDLPRDIVAFLKMGPEAVALFNAVPDDAPGRLTFAQVQFDAPVPAPEKFFGDRHVDRHSERRRHRGEATPLPERRRPDACRDRRTGTYRKSRRSRSR